MIYRFDNVERRLVNDRTYDDRARYREEEEVLSDREHHLLCLNTTDETAVTGSKGLSISNTYLPSKAGRYGGSLKARRRSTRYPAKGSE
jgi:hypothetical protein